MAASALKEWPRSSLLIAGKTRRSADVRLTPNYGGQPSPDGNEIRFSAMLAFRLEARGVEPLFPACYVQQRPRMVYQGYFRGEDVFDG
jgi:hypothetical protein